MMKNRKNNRESENGTATYRKKYQVVIEDEESDFGDIVKINGRKKVIGCQITIQKYTTRKNVHREIQHTQIELKTGKKY